MLGKGLLRDSAFSRWSELLPYEAIEFLKDKQDQNCTVQTLKTYNVRLTKFFNFLQAEGYPLSVPDIENTHIKAYLHKLRLDGCSAHYRDGQYRVLTTFFNYCRDMEWVRGTPMDHIPKIKLPKKSKEFLSVGQFKQLLVSCNPYTYLGCRNASILMLLWTTGMRIGEVANLHVGDLDFKAEKIKVREAKGQTDRVVPFLREPRKMVLKYIRDRERRLQRYGIDNSPHLWITEEGQPLRLEGINSMLDRIYAFSGVKVQDKAHIFRRTWAYRNLKRGIPIKYVQLVGGWQSVTTLEGYVRSMKSEEVLRANWC